MLENLRQSRTGVKVALAIIWLLYAPFALIVFAFSGFAFDAGASAFAWRAFFIINGIPLAVMLITLWLAVRRNSMLIALSPPAIFLLIWVGLGTFAVLAVQ